jgi:hypothetical protein
VKHEAPPELGGHVPCPGLVPLNDPHRHAGLLECEGEPQPDAAAAVDRHLLDRLGIGCHGLDNLGDAPPAADEQDVIPPLQHGISTGHESFPAPYYPDHEAGFREPEVP